MARTVTSKIKQALTRKQPRKADENKVKAVDLLSSGSTLINLACTGNAKGAFAKGKFHYVVGDSESGKTFVTLTCAAEACKNKNFSNYRVIYDNVEDGALMDWEEFFGSQAAKRIAAPAYDENMEPVYSSTIEDLYDHLDDAVEAGTPFIYILDSMDALTSADEEKKAREQKDARRKGRDAAGSYGDGKAKKNSANLRRILSKLRKTGSVLIIISQTRDNLGFGFDPKTRSGGRALKFYATLEMWTSIKQKLRKKINGKKLGIGIIAKVEVKKNRFTGKHHTVNVPIYNSTGIDEVGSCVNYLIENKHWKMSGAMIRTPEFEFKGNRTKLIRYIENNDLEDDLQEIVTMVWRQIEDACIVKRKKRYD